MERKKVNESIIKEIAKYFLSKDTIKEKDLIRLVPSRKKLVDIIKILNYRFSLLGCEIIKTDFLEEDYYVLVLEGKEKELSEENYGILAIISFLNWDYNHFLTHNDALKIFSDFKKNIDSLIKLEYLIVHNIDEVKYIIPTPIAKVLFKNMINKINIEDIFRSIGIDTDKTLPEITPIFPEDKNLKSLLPLELQTQVKIIQSVLEIIKKFPKGKTFSYIKIRNEGKSSESEEYKEILEKLQIHGFLEKATTKSYKLSNIGEDLITEVFQSK